MRFDLSKSIELARQRFANDCDLAVQTVRASHPQMDLGNPPATPTVINEVAKATHQAFAMLGWNCDLEFIAEFNERTRTAELYLKPTTVEGYLLLRGMGIDIEHMKVDPLLVLDCNVRIKRGDHLDVALEAFARVVSERGTYGEIEIVE